MSQAMSRRRALQFGGAAAAVPLLGAAAWELFPRSNRGGAGLPTGPTPRVERAGSVSGTSAYLHVIAHADDGLFFQNPDLLQAITSGVPAVTVCLTGGESDGVNGPVPKGHKPPPRNRAAFVRARMNGLRAAHAQMATGDENSPWDIESLELIPGFQVELNSLREAPQVQLIWLELQEARAVSLPNPVSLKGLWLGAATHLPTLRPTGSPVPRRYDYTRADVVASLTAVLRTYRPTVVRTLDPNPVHQFRQPPDFGAGHRVVPPLLRLPVYQDHQDHTYSAYFVQQALQDYYRGEAGGSAVRDCSVESYLGYVNGILPWTLGASTRDRKQQYLDTYGDEDHRDCGDPAGCGDHKVDRPYAHGLWSVSTRYSAPGSGEWLQPLADGRLVAFGLLAGAAKFWLESAPGSGSWSGPHLLTGDGGAGLEGQLTAVRLPDRRLALFGVRHVLADTVAGHRRELVTCVQQSDAAGLPVFGDWQSLDSPESGAQKSARSMEMGHPVAVVTAAGGVQVFVRDWAGSVSTRVQDAAGVWGAWSALPQAKEADPRIGVIDGLGAVRGADGRMHVFAGSTRAVLHWASAVPGGPLRPTAPTGLPVAGSPISAVAHRDGSIGLYYREPRTAQILVANLPVGAAAWAVTQHGTVPGGFGRVVAAELGNSRGGAVRTVLAARDDQGRVAMTVDPGPAGNWSQQGGFHTGSPGVALDAAGRAVVAAFGPDGLLHLAQQATATPLAPFRAWASAAPTASRA